MQFKFDPQAISSVETIAGVKGDSKEDPRIEAIEDLQTKVEDDFDYVITGIERLVREGMMDDASSLLNTLAETLDSAVSIIGNDFDKAGE